MDYKSLKIDFTCKAIDGQPTTFEGEASTFGNTDLTGDIIKKGAFTETLKTRMPKLLWQHKHSELIGGFDEVRETATGLFVKGRLTRGVQRADEAARLMHDGYLNAMSIGFEVVDMDIGKDTTTINKVKLHEISLVTFPANERALIQSVKALAPFNAFKAAPVSIDWVESDANVRLRKFTDSTNKPNNPAYADAFLWRDTSKPESFDSYKFQFVDVVDGELRVMKRALDSILDELKSEKSLPDDDVLKVKQHIKKYYKTVFSTDIGLPIDVACAKTITDKQKFEKLLRDSGVCSKDAATFLASQFQPRRSESVSSLNKEIEARYAEILKQLVASLNDDIKA